MYLVEYTSAEAGNSKVSFFFSTQIRTQLKRKAYEDAGLPPPSEPSPKKQSTQKQQQQQQQQVVVEQQAAKKQERRGKV